MRKWLWFAAAAAVVGSGGIGYYAYQQPQSAVGQLVTQVGEFGIQVNPVTQMTRQVLAAARLNQKQTVCCQPRECQEEIAPDDPTPVEEPACKQLEGTVEFTPAVRLPEVEKGAPVADPSAFLPIGMAPVPEEGCVPVAGTQPGRCPRSMPYCPQEGAGKKMPYTPDTNVDPYDPTNFAGQVLPPLNGPGSMPGAPGSTEEAETKEGKPNTSESMPGETKPDESGTEMGSMSDYYHSQQAAHSRYIVCPYSGKCVESSPSCDSDPKCKSTKSECQPSKEQGYERIAPPAEEESETKEPEQSKTAPKAKKRKPVIKTQSRYCPNLPLCPYIDTMEYRASDRSLNETGPGPF